MSTKQEELKQINEAKKELADKAKALRVELDANKEERKEARKTQSEARKSVRELKAKMRENLAAIYDVFSENDSEEIEALADGITDVAAEISGIVRKFSEASAVL